MSLDLNLKILVVDDMETMQKIVASHLMQIGFKEENIERAKDGLQAIKVMLEAYKEQNPFHLIVCDWNMPGLTGLEFLKKIRAAKHTARLPFLMVTSETQKDMIKLAFDAGVDEYITKPISTDELREKIENIFIV